MKIVTDTNILISALGWKGYEYDLIRLVFTGEIELFTTPEIIEEFLKVSTRKKFGFSPHEIEEFISAVLEVSNVFMPEISINEIKDDPSDNIFLECALEGNVDFIITGDRHLLNLGQFENIKIMNASSFIKNYWKNTND